MQTFIPEGCDFSKIASILDDKRLNKQISEVRTIVNVLEGRSKGWQSHPAVRMWTKNIECLKLYHNYMLYEWKEVRNRNRDNFYYNLGEIYYPEFLWDKRVLLSHKSNLVRKKPDHYMPFFGNVDYGIDGYYWPVEPKTKRAREINNMWNEIIN